MSGSVTRTLDLPATPDDILIWVGRLPAGTQVHAGTSQGDRPWESDSHYLTATYQEES